ncbi:alpha mannosidase-like protein [Tulasnella sp. 331]|nr:alpha mannosidase-like protein [Tulasnella sp. 331]
MAANTASRGRPQRAIISWCPALERRKKGHSPVRPLPSLREIKEIEMAHHIIERKSVTFGIMASIAIGITVSDCYVHVRVYSSLTMMAAAFPLDELQPLSCKGKGPDWDNPEDHSANDVNGNYSITLIDILDTFVTLGDPMGFEKAVSQVIDHVSFDVDTRPQVFETTIRVLGGLLSAHQMISSVPVPETNPRLELAPVVIPWYRGELLDLALDLGRRLLPAFNTPTGMPYARVNLRSGVLRNETNQTCAAGAGTLLLEFTVLSRLTGDPQFEQLAKKSYQAVWDRRSSLDLVGNPIDVVTGDWDHPQSGGIGAGIDSFYEYALKMYVLTGEKLFLDIWDKAYAAIMRHSRGTEGYWYRAIGMHTGELSAAHVDSLGAFWPGLQVLAGDLENAIKAHLYLFLLFDEENPLNKLDSNFVFTTEGHVLQLRRADLNGSISSSQANQTSQGASTCARHVASSSWPGIAGSIRDRTDYDYARHLVGVEGNASAVEDDSDRWDIYGKCDMPRHEIFKSDFVLTPHGNKSAEDLDPGLEKIVPVEEGFIVYNVEGVRIKATTTVDQDGYVIYQIGTHPVRASQKIYFADRRLLRGDDEMEAGMKQVYQLHRERQVPLRFSVEQLDTKAEPTRDLDLAILEPLIATGVTANFGQHPVKELGQKDWVANTPRFGRGWPALPLIQPPSYNKHGCKPHIGSPTSEEEPYTDPDSPFLPRPYEGAVLLLERGGCTFFEMLDLASLAGASGIVITSEGYVTPTLLPEEEQFQTAQLYLSHVGLVVVSGAQNVKALEGLVDASKRNDFQVMVGIEADAPELEVTSEEKKPAVVIPLDKREMHTSLRKTIPSRPLYINNKRVRNSVLLF